MPIPNHRINYTKSAQEVYDMAQYKGYKFLKSRKLDSWLSYGWSILFMRPMTDFDITAIKGFLTKKKALDLKIKCNEKLSHSDRMFQNNFIGADGYIYMNKMICGGELKNPKETARLNKLLKQAEKDRLARYEEYEIKHLHEMAQKQKFNNEGHTYKGHKIKWD